MEKILNLKNVQEFLENIPYINSGGCGVSTLAMYRWLKKNQDLDGDKFVFMYSDKSSFLNNKRILRGEDGKPSAPKHCCLLHDGEFIDSAGDVDLKEYSWIQIIDEEEFIKKTVNNVNDWNYSFDRKNIKEIEETLKINLSDLEI